MNMMMAKIQRFVKIRRIHTITSKETIKPSSPTPSHLSHYNLLMADNLISNVHVPWVFFYKNYKNGDNKILKRSLSKCLTQYYPFAGRLLAPSALHINCNDEGVEFLETCIDIPLRDFILKRERHESINQLIPNIVNQSYPNILEVQLNHFPCGGAAVAVSISHKVGDAYTMLNFVNHWATVTRGGSPVNPSFISTPAITNTNFPEYFPIEETAKAKYIERRFVFPNSKLSDLKNKINAMGITPLNPTRVESLTSLLFKCAVDAATKKSGSFKPSKLSIPVNMREKLSTVACPKSAVGNIITVAMAKMADSGEIQLNKVITSLRKDRMEIQGVTDVDKVAEDLSKKLLYLAQDQSHRTYSASSACGFPAYQVDFGWGKPERVMVLPHSYDQSHIIFMDSASGDGIEAIVQLEAQEMALFQNDKQLLAYLEDS